MFVVRKMNDFECKNRHIAPIVQKVVLKGISEGKVKKWDFIGISKLGVKNRSKKGMEDFGIRFCLY